MKASVSHSDASSCVHIVNPASLYRSRRKRSEWLSHLVLESTLKKISPGDTTDGDEGLNILLAGGLPLPGCVCVWGRGY